MVRVPDTMSEYIGSPYLIVLATHGEYTLTKAQLHEDYNVWRGGDIICWGGRELATKTFEGKKGPKKMTNQPVDINHRVEQYIKLRDMIKKKDDDHKDAMAPFREALEKLNALLLSHLDAVGVDSAKASAGTVYKTVKKSASLEDADQFMRHVIGTENWDLLERKASQKAVEAFLEENGVLPPGVKFSQTIVVGVRKS